MTRQHLTSQPASAPRGCTNRRGLQTTVGKGAISKERLILGPMAFLWGKRMEGFLSCRWPLLPVGKGEGPVTDDLPGAGPENPGLVD